MNLQYLSKRKLIGAYEHGHLDAVAKQCFRYGDIVGDKSWSEPSGYHAGEHRVTMIRHYNLLWKIKKRNGDVVSVGYVIR